MTKPSHHPLIMVAPNGARRTKADHPEIPVTLEETLATAKACFKAGAQALHLHVREEDASHSLDAGRYREALAELAQTLPQMRVQITTEAGGIFSVDQQLSCLKNVAPGWASISVREVARDPSLAPKLYATCADIGCEVQHILYDTADVELLLDWQHKGIIHPGQTGVLFVLGRYTSGQTSDPDALQGLMSAHPALRDWMLCAFGAQEHACLLKAAQAGGNLRVGFENSLLQADGTPHPDNAASVTTLISQLESPST